MTTPTGQPPAHNHRYATPADLPNAAATPPHPLPHQPVHAEVGSHPQPPAPRTPTDDACPPGAIPPGVDPDDWERNLRRVLEGMPRTINPASARILADLLAADHTPTDRARDTRPPTTSQPRAGRGTHPAGGACGCG
ncbi:MAG: hypothetical protein ACRDS0_27385 [Pseudonocardiaceae bacterium]